MRMLFVLCAVATMLLTACGGGSEATLTPKEFHHKLDFEFTIGEGGESPQGRALTQTLKSGTLVSCWNEGPERVCAAAVPKGYGGGISFLGKVSEWTFYRAVFKVGSIEPEIEEVSPEEALRPSGSP
jgi:hypothetical protein